MSSWSELRVILADLAADPRQPLESYTSPEAADASPPFHVSLQAWAQDIAAALHRRFGEEVDVTVGALRYPDCVARHAGLRQPEPELPLLRPDELTVSIDQPIQVESGHPSRSELRVHNHQDHPESVLTNGQINARILDPATSVPVGGVSGFQTMPGIGFDIPAHGSTTIPLLIGTASTDPSLGYAIPPGDWSFDAVLTLERGTYRTPPLPFTITP
jgi:hypothetical protein